MTAITPTRVSVADDQRRGALPLHYNEPRADLGPHQQQHLAVVLCLGQRLPVRGDIIDGLPAGLLDEHPGAKSREGRSASRLDRGDQDARLANVAELTGEFRSQILHRHADVRLDMVGAAEGLCLCR